MASHSAARSTRAQPMRWRPKKSQDQAAFSANCTRNSARAGATGPAPLLPDQPGGDPHHQVEQGPHRGEDPGRGIKGGLGQVGVPVPRREPGADPGGGKAQGHPEHEADPGR